jgi:flavin reductase (DIM6/NTAB) family NADH-FMN oxidoreductase RutF
MNVVPSELSHRDLYHILIGAVGPRPIAWVSTLDRNGQPNLAPFSFFNAISAKPPLLGFSPGLRKVEDRSHAKDTLSNIRETGEFVVNVVTFDLAEKMNLTSGEYAHETNEFELAGLTPAPSEKVKPPRVAESPVGFECKLERIIDFGTEWPSSSLVIGEIVGVHLEERVMKGDRFDLDAVDLIGRMGGNQYTRATQRFEMERPTAERK